MAVWHRAGIERRSDRHGAPCIAQPARQIERKSVGQLKVKQGEIGYVALDHLLCRRQRRRNDHLQAALVQGILDGHCYENAVLHHQHNALAAGVIGIRSRFFVHGRVLRAHSGNQPCHLT